MNKPQSLFSSEIKTTKPRETKKNQGLSRAWIRCPSGRRFDLLSPSPIDVEVEDIALSLSRICRWAGMTQTPYGFSVAQHSVLVVDLMEWMFDTNKEYQDFLKNSPYSKWQWLLAGLLHDASEGYLGGDLCGPAKNAFSDDSYRKIEDKIQEAIHLRFNLPAIYPIEMKKMIKDADRASAYAESILIAGFTKEEADPIFGIKTDLHENAKIMALSPTQANDIFMDKYNYISKKI